MLPRSIAILGAGGKTTLLAALAQAARPARVLITTTTHIYPFGSDVCDRLCIDPDAQTLRQACAAPGVTCAGSTAADGKLGALPEDVRVHAAPDYLFYEADGAARRPLKLHRPDEPVILPDTACCVLVAGLSALGQPVSTAVHRFALHPAWQADPAHPVSAADILLCIREGLAAAGQPCCVLLSQCTDPERMQAARQLLQALHADGIPAAIFDREAPARACALLASTV